MPNENLKPTAGNRPTPEGKANQSSEKTVIRSLALGGLIGGGAPCFVDVKEGKIIRIRPLHYDWKHDLSKVNAWKFARNGKTIEPTSKSLPCPFSLAYKKRTYSPNRIKYPLKRVDWDPRGERNPQNRGISQFVRISWDEAAAIVAGEIQRMYQQYGPYAILAQVDGHGECKIINAPHGCPTLLLEKAGGYTQQIRNPDSWEGWYWGAKHVWGNGDVGMMAPFANVVKDTTENSDMVLFWGCDPETTPWGFTGQFASRMCFFWKEAGIRQVYVCPDVNYGAAVHADKWIPILPNTDAALQLAIAYVWITEGTYDKEYVKSHTVGMDKLEAYVLGREDNIPKTPAWASAKCGVPEWTIKALARDWASKRTSVAHYCGGSYIRGPYSHEPARLEVILLGMQGLGKPGIHQAAMIFRNGMPRVEGIGGNIFQNPGFAEISKPHQITAYVATKQHIPKTLIHKAIPNPPVSYWGTGAIQTTVDNQFKKYTYPIPQEEGGGEVHMIWTDSPCRTTCWNGGNETIEAFRNPKIECVVAQHPWLENDCLLADIILPSNTTLEVEDIVGNTRWGVQYPTFAIQRPAIDPIGESKSDREVVIEIAKKLGQDAEITHGQSTADLIKVVYDGMGLQNFISWEEFCEKDYYVYSCAPDWEKDPPGFRKFYEDPEKNPLPTPTGKLEFYSAALAQHFPTDEERPPIPKWIEKSETHDERRGGPRSEKFPLLVMSNHGRWRVHAQCDD
ncbi:MAG: molybdopterin oxidoreductase, partial [Chloroflexi bacterium]|nr:molybdopterin oxidoreductase [Chloroflexota bacterium]